MINADIVFSRETIYNRIRDAIEKDPADPQHILTIWGVGYKFRP